MAVVDWQAEFGRGALSFAVLAALAHQPQHGYALNSHLRAHGFPRLQGGTLYPHLRRMEEQRLVSHAWDTAESGPARKVFSLTDLGRAELTHARTAWAALGASIDAVSSTSP